MRLIEKAARQLNPDAYVELVYPERRTNDAHNPDELLMIGAFDREARADGIRHNLQHVLGRLGLPRRGEPGYRPGDAKRISRLISEARETFKNDTLFLDGRHFP